MPDTTVIGRLSEYRKVITFRRDRAPAGVHNGIRTARMQLHRTIPASVRIAGEMVRIWYPDQPLTCRKCGGIDHRAGGCTTPRCFNCEQPGHRAHQCPKPPLCGVCTAEGHHEATCPFVIQSGDIEETGTQVTYAAAVADEAAVANEAAAANAPAERKKRVVKKAKLAPPPPSPIPFPSPFPAEEEGPRTDCEKRHQTSAQT